MTRFLHKDAYGAKDLWRYVKPSIRKIEQKKGGILAIDDTIEEKPYTDENEVISWHFSHNKGRHLKGVNLLSALVRYGEIALPIGFEVIKKAMHYCELKSKKEKRQASITKNEHFKSLVRQCFDNQVLFEHVLADSWFGSNDNMSFIHYDIKKYFIFGLKSNRLVSIDQGGPFQTLEFKAEEVKRVWLKELNFPVQVAKIVFINGDNTKGILYLVSNDFTLTSATAIFDLYKKRWCIEEYHKSIKVNASLAKSPTRKVLSQCNHIFASIVAYIKLEMIKIRTNLNHFALRYKILIKANQAAYAALRILSNYTPDCVT